MSRLKETFVLLNEVYSAMRRSVDIMVIYSHMQSKEVPERTSGTVAPRVREG